MKKNTNVMACGCAVVIEEDGKVTTSVDQLVKFIGRLTSRSEQRSERRAAVAHA